MYSDRDIKQWITVNGRHIPIYSDDIIAKGNEAKRLSDIQKNKEEADRLNAEKRRPIKLSDTKQLNELLSTGGVQASELVDRVDYKDKNKFKLFTDTTPDNSTSLSTQFVEDEGRDEWRYMKRHSNFDSLINEAEKNNEHIAFKRWTQGKFMDGQQYRGFSNMNDIDKQTTQILDKYLDRAQVDTGIVVNRRATPEMLGLANRKYTARDLQNMRGNILVSKGNMSTCAASEGLLIGADDDEKPINYRIHIPAGAKGAGMWVGDKRINHWESQQREFLMNRDTVFLVGSVTDDAKDYYSNINGNKYSRPFVTVDLFYIGRLPHDYN